MMIGTGPYDNQFGGRLSHQELEKSRRSASKPVLEQHEPGLGDGPGRHDVGQHRQLIDDPSARHIGAHHQPGQRSTDQQRQQCGPNGDGHRMLQWGIRINSTNHACQHPDPVKNG